MLTTIKLLHTVIWAILAGCILTLPVLAVSHRFRWAAVITVVVLLEWTVLAINGGRRPLTDIATRYTLDRASNFDIYLPSWLAEHNKLIFGLLFIVGEFVVIGRWIRVKSGISLQAATPDHTERRQQTKIMHALKADILYFRVRLRDSALRPHG